MTSSFNPGVVLDQSTASNFFPAIFLLNTTAGNHEQPGAEQLDLVKRSNKWTQTTAQWEAEKLELIQWRSNQSTSSTDKWAEQFDPLTWRSNQSASSTEQWSEQLNPVTYRSNQSASDDDVWLKATLSQIRMTFLPIILLGTVTNCLNFVLLSHKEMRPHSTSVFLFALAVADIGVMYLELFRVWFEWTQIIDPKLYFNDVYCGVANYTNGVARDFANWLIACLTMERLIKVRPLSLNAFLIH